MTINHPNPPLRWRKSTHSGAQSDCVEVAPLLPTTTAVRDSKRTHDGVLVFTSDAWSKLLSRTRP